LHVADKGFITLSELAANVELEAEDVKRRMLFWVSRNIVRERSRPHDVKLMRKNDEIVYEIVENQSQDGRGGYSYQYDQDINKVNRITIINHDHDFN